MRLLFISSFYPPHDLGGYEKHCHEVATGLRARGHDVEVLTSRHGAAAPMQDDHVRRALYLESDLRYYSPGRFFVCRGREERYNAEVLQNTITDVAPDVILFWGMWNLSRRVPALAESTGVPVAYWLEDLWPIDPDTHVRYWQSPGSGRLGRAVMPWVARLALRQLAAEGYPPPLHYRHVACGSQFLQRKLAAQIPAFQGALVVMCGIELEAYAGCQPHERLHDAVAPRIIYLGGLGPHKGVHTAIEAVSELAARSPGLQPSLTVVGSGHPKYEARLRRLADDGSHAGRIRFTGAVAKESVPSQLVEHDILVVPSVWEEPFGRVVVEGMAAGLPVVGTATGGSAEILKDEVNGLVFPVEDSGALADRLLRLVNNQVLYARLARAGRETSQRFDLHFMIDGLERFLLDVAASGTQGTAT